MGRILTHYRLRITICAETAEPIFSKSYRQIANWLL